MTAFSKRTLWSQSAAIRSGSPRKRENAEKSTSATGIAISESGRMTVLMAKVHAPRAGTPTSPPISTERTSNSPSLAQRPPTMRIAKDPSGGRPRPRTQASGATPARHQSAAAKVTSRTIC